jgi:hypothetical protein
MSSLNSECHGKFYRLWSASRHGLAMQPYTPEFARANLTPQTKDLVIGECRYRADTSLKAGWVLETGPQGKKKKYRILHALGGENVYYFLTPLERGRLQTLPVAYDVHAKRWFDTAASGCAPLAPGHPKSRSTGKSGPSTPPASTVMSASSAATMTWLLTPIGPLGQSLASTVRRVTAPPKSITK